MINLNNINKQKTNILLIRHSERYQLPQEGFGMEVSLTPKGIEMAKEFGNKIQQFELNQTIYTSPIKRCVQTAENIAKNYSHKTKISQSSMLGLPSVFVNDGQKAGETFKSMTQYQFYRKYISNIYLEGWNDFEKSCIELDDFFRSSASKELTLFISHDIIVMFFIYFKTGKIFSENEWLNFLDGIIYSNDD